jgi:hypothetical protein
MQIGVEMGEEREKEWERGLPFGDEERGVMNDEMKEAKNVKKCEEEERMYNAVKEVRKKVGV